MKINYKKKKNKLESKRSVQIIEKRYINFY